MILQKTLFGFPLMLMVLTVIACGGSDPETRSPSGSPNPVVAQGTEAVGQSAQNLAKIKSGEAEFEWSVRREGFEIEGNGTYLTEAPDKLHLDAHYQGSGDVPSSFREENDSELLILSESIYVSSPSLGDSWVLFSPEEFAADWNVVQRLIAARSPLDYQAAVGAATAIENLGAEEIDGRSYQHYRASVDASVLMDGLADAYGSQGQVFLAGRFSGPVTMEIWVDPATILPRRLRGAGEFSFLDRATDLELNVEFLDLNGQPDIPEAPSDVVTFAELTGGG